MNVGPCLAVAGFLLATSSAHAATLAACGPQKGHAYFPAAGAVPEGEDGWTEDQVSAGSTTLTMSDNGELDILFKDSRDEIVSSRNDGGRVILLRKSSNEMAVLVAYPEGAQAAEIYAFVRQTDGKAKMLLLSSKGLTAPVAIPKAGVYVADCSTLALP